jgi:hypothetical protein
MIGMPQRNERIRVVLVIDDLEYGGAQHQEIELANNMCRDRFDVHVCTLSNYVPLSSQLRDSEHKIHTVVKKNKVDFTVVSRLACLLKSLNADIIHSYLFSADKRLSLVGGRVSRREDSCHRYLSFTGVQSCCLRGQI